MNHSNPYASGLDKNAANFAALTPSSFLARSAYIYPERIAVVHGARRFNWAQVYARSRRLASALVQQGCGPGVTVAVMLNNTPEMFECHFGVPMSGAVLNTLNTRLDGATIAFMLQHSEARVLIVDREYAPTVKAVLALLQEAQYEIQLIEVDDPEYHGAEVLIGGIDYEAFIASGAPNFAWQPPADEWDAISLNYTSGTTGNPKGVVYHHRGAYLNALSNIVSWGMPPHAVYLWTLPMFHCNGWCFPWTIAANAGVNICLRRVDAQGIFDAIREHHVTHYCGAPIVHSLLINAPAEWRAGIDHTVHALSGGAPPPAAIIEGMERIGFDITHVYGLTETYGPAAVCAKHEAWNALDITQRTERNGRQGVTYHAQEAMSVIDSLTMQPVPWDGETIGEVMFRGNLTMKGYLKNPQASAEAFAGGWYHTGDLAVMQPDGYVKIKDRSKDVIISGGENISSIEVEDVLYRHPAVLAAAVVATPDAKWGEIPSAFVEFKPGMQVSAEELHDYCRAHLAHFKVPRQFIFTTLPRTATGKIQKFMLRKQVRSAQAIE